MDKIAVKDLYGKSDIDYIDNYIFSKENPWDLLGGIKEYVKTLCARGIDGFTIIDDDVLVGKNVKIAKTATIIGPTIIGNNVEIRPGAYIRGSVIVGDDSVVGNSSELKNAILMRHAQVPHYNYVGDSIIGNFAHMGAGSITSNVKSAKEKRTDTIVVILLSLGAILMVFPLVYMVCASFMTKGQILSGNFSLIPDPFKAGTYNEVIFHSNFLQGVRNKVEMREMKKFLSKLSFSTLPITANISSRAVAIMEETALRSDLGVCDALIFATARETGETLLSGNKRHFKEVALLNAEEFKPE